MIFTKRKQKPIFEYYFCPRVCDVVRKSRAEDERGKTRAEPKNMQSRRKRGFLSLRGVDYLRAP